MLPYTNRARSRGSREDMELERSCTYDLLSVVVHVGEIETGHYVSYCRVGDQVWPALIDLSVCSFSLIITVVQVQRSQGRAGQDVGCAWRPGVSIVLYHPVSRLGGIIVYAIIKDTIPTIPTIPGLWDELAYNPAYYIARQYGYVSYFKKGHLSCHGCLYIQLPVYLSCQYGRAYEIPQWHPLFFLYRHFQFGHSKLA